MLTDRIIGAFMFRQEVYAEVEQDTTFTRTAWLLVMVVAFLNQLGSKAPQVAVEELPQAFRVYPFTGSSLVDWLGATIVGTAFAVIGFWVLAFVANWVARTVFNADVTFDELVRTLGLAYVWQAVGVLGVLRVLSVALSCLAAPLGVAATLLGVAASFIAMREALDLDSVQTIATVLLAWLAWAIINLVIGGIVIGVLGFRAFVWSGLFG
jgi:hypothetical protein